MSFPASPYIVIRQYNKTEVICQQNRATYRNIIEEAIYKHGQSLEDDESKDEYF